MRKVFSLLLALLVVMSMAVPAFAKEVEDPGTVNIGPERSKAIVITPDLNKLTDTDLFGNFKGVMPGDKLTEEIEIRNWALQYDYVKVYLQAVPHGKDNAPKIGEDHNADFLSQLEMIVTNNSKVIYHAGPDEEYQLDAAGDLKDPVYLGKLTRSNSIKTMELDVELIVPIEMDNWYANAMAEVDWVFLFEGLNYSGDSPKTGDYVIITAVTTLALSGAALVVLLVLKKKRK